MVEPATSLPKLSAEEAILLHLHSRHGSAAAGDEMRAPLTLTQAGIAAATGIHHRNVSRYLVSLITGGAITEHRGHVPGTPRRVKFYRLTVAGLRT
ncbi:MAG TPA: hypothetical protein VI893_00400, partial [Thermoplasmata archaeon]|nr:hypothetical protein [Thermoplasmata archaeon]